MAIGFGMHRATERIIKLRPGQRVPVHKIDDLRSVSESAWRSRFRTAKFRTGYHYRLVHDGDTWYVECEET